MTHHQNWMRWFSFEKGAFGSPSTGVANFTLHRGVEEGGTPFLGLLHFTLDPNLIILSVKHWSFWEE